jgi:hypothetical protein
LEALTSQEFAPFIVCFSGEKEVAERVSAWAAAQIYPILHVSSVDALGTCSPDDFNDERLRAYCVDVLEKRASDFTQDLWTLRSVPLAIGSITSRRQQV